MAETTELKIIKPCPPSEDIPFSPCMDFGHHKHLMTDWWLCRSCESKGCEFCNNIGWEKYQRAVDVYHIQNI